MDAARLFDVSTAVGGVGWVAVGGLLLAGTLPLAGLRTATLAVVLAVAVVVPLVARLADLPFRDGFRSPWYRAAAVLTLPAAVAVVVSLALPTGPLAGGLAVPWLVVTVSLAIFGVQRGIPHTDHPAELAVSVGLAYLPVAGVALLLYRLDLTVGFAATTMLLTVVHFHYAGCALPVFVGLLGRDVGGGRRYLAMLAVVVVGPGFIGLGIALSPVVELVAAVTFAAVVGGVAVYTLVVLGGLHDGRALVGLAAVSVAASMGVVATYLATPWLARPLVTFETVLAGHGWLNAVGFALLGLVGWRIANPPSALPPLGLPISRLTASRRVGPAFLDRPGVRSDGSAAGMVDDFSAFDGPTFESARVHPDVRRFYERTAEYSLRIGPTWGRGFRSGARLYARFSRRVEQMNFPIDEREPDRLSSRIVPVDDAADGRDGVRAWLRTYDETGDAIYVALYSTHRLDGRPYMNIAFPLPWTNLTSVLSVEPLGIGDPDGVELSTVTGGDAGIYLRTPLGPLRLPMDETIRVWSADVAGPAGGALESDGPELYASHQMSLFGRRFLELDYRMTRLS